MKPTHLIVGMGEVGRAVHEVFTQAGQEVFTKDIEEKQIPPYVNIIHIALNYYGLGHEKFLQIVQGYLTQVRSDLLDVCSTVRPGTTETLRMDGCHSTTRGLHPNLTEGLRTITKHVGGSRAKEIAQIYGSAGVRCIIHGKARTTELAHILNNSAYGVALMFADEMQSLCREYGVDYFEAVMKYTATHNAGFRALDHERLVRPILTPPFGRIGGHCVTQGASLIPENIRGPLMSRLARYNDDKIPDTVDGHCKDMGSGVGPGMPELPGTCEDSAKADSSHRDDPSGGGNPEEPREKV